MARPAFKAWWTRIIPHAMERSTFVIATCAVFALLFWQWRAMPEFVWHVENPVGRGLLFAISAAGILLVLYASFCIDHFDLFGLRQVILNLRGKRYTHPGFARPVLYRIVRNPLMLGFIVAFWSTPDMTVGHLFFAAMTTGYIIFGVSMEERDLLKLLGEEYRLYRERTPMLIPGLRRRRAEGPQRAKAAPVV
jgi:protein-S-isoprenylcysteine O-methyltransferase Ste14